MKNIAVDLVENNKTFRLCISDSIESNIIGDTMSNVWLNIVVNIWNKTEVGVKTPISQNIIRNSAR